MARNWRTGSHSDMWRKRIRAGVIMQRLEACVLGKIEMTNTQIRAAEVLLRKIIPDLSAVEYTGNVEHRHITEYTDAELQGFLQWSHDRELRQRITAEARGTGLTAAVHGVHDPELEGGEDPPTH